MAARIRTGLIPPDPIPTHQRARPFFTSGARFKFQNGKISCSRSHPAFSGPSTANFVHNPSLAASLLALLRQLCPVHAHIRVGWLRRPRRFSGGAAGTAALIEHVTTVRGGGALVKDPPSANSASLLKRHKGRPARTSVKQTLYAPPISASYSATAGCEIAGQPLLFCPATAVLPKHKRRCGEHMFIRPRFCECNRLLHHECCQRPEKRLWNGPA